MKRILLLIMLTLALGLTLTGCASSADAAPTADPRASQNPVMPSNIPQATDQGMLGDLGETIGNTLTGRDNPLTTAEDALKASRELRDAVQKLTEVDTAVAVTAGNTALVGVTFDGSYKGGVDDRLRAMILDRAQAVHPGITRVAVTEKTAEIDQISSLFRALQSNGSYTTLKTDVDTMATKLDVYQK